MATTRGIRNNNPTNIRFNPRNAWKGKVYGAAKKDKAFEEFVTMGHGLRAGVVLLNNYIKQGHNTLHKMIAKFAPNGDGNNNETVYVAHIAKHTPITATQILTKRDVPYIVQAMCSIESRYVVDIETILKSLTL